MSPKQRKSVSQLIEKYRRLYPYLERDLLRKLIRQELQIENGIVNPSELRKLDRHLRKEFKKKNSEQEERTLSGNIKGVVIIGKVPETRYPRKI